MKIGVEIRNERLKKVLNKLIHEAVMGQCASCGKAMIGYGKDDECMECAFPEHAKAAEEAAKAVEDHHFKLSGERVPAGELLRDVLGMNDRPEGGQIRGDRGEPI